MSFDFPFLHIIFKVVQDMSPAVTTCAGFSNSSCQMCINIV